MNLSTNVVSDLYMLMYITHTCTHTHLGRRANPPHVRVWPVGLGCVAIVHVVHFLISTHSLVNVNSFLSV